MNLHLGADVRRADGDRLGELHGVVYSPNEQRAMALVVQSAGADARDILVTLRAVESVDADGEVVYLSLTQDQFDAMRPLYSDEHNIAPPPTADNIDPEFEQEPLVVPDVPPVGAATGVESIAFIPVISEESNLREGDVIIARETTISATDGNIGGVERLLLDDATYRLTGLVGDRGLIFHHDVTVPADAITSITDDRIEVAGDRDSFQRSENG